MSTLGRFQMTRKISENDIKLFADVTGDYNPIHLEKGEKDQMYHKTGVINDPLGQIHRFANNHIHFQLKIVRTSLP